MVSCSVIHSSCWVLYLRKAFASPHFNGRVLAKTTLVVLLAVVPLIAKPISAVAGLEVLVKITVYVPSLLSTTVPSVPAELVRVIVPPLVVKLVPLASFNRIVMVVVLIPFAVISDCATLMVEVMELAATGT